MPFDEGGLKFKFLYEPQIFVKEIPALTLGVDQMLFLL